MAITPCGCTQVLESDATEFDVCDNAGSPAFTESGSTNIPVSATALTVTFGTRKASIDYVFVELAVENLVDSNALQISTGTIQRGLDSFRVSLTGLADTTNYFLRWNVYVRSI